MKKLDMKYAIIKKIKFVKNLKGIIIIFCFFLFTSSTLATHFRYGDISYRVDANDPTGRTIIFKVNTGWRTTWTNALKVDLVFESLGGGNNTNIGRVPENLTSDANGVKYYSGEISYTFPTNGQFKVFYSACCKISNLQNNKDQMWYVYTTVDVGSGNNSPVTSLPAIAYVQEGKNATFNIPSVDPDGDLVTYRLATNKDGWVGSQPSGFSVSTNGQAIFNTIGKTIGHLYNAAVVIIDSNGAEILVDFILEVTKQSNPPRWDYSDGKTPADGFAYQTSPGAIITFPLEAFDTDTGSKVSISASGMPVGATISPSFGTFGNPINHVFSWTPTASQFGQYLINFTAQDNDDVTISTSVSINISLNPVFDVGPTPDSGMHNIIVSPGNLIQYTVQVSDPDPADVVRIIALEGKDYNTGNPIPIYTGASLGPLPTVADNPSSGTFIWTPTQAQWGHKHIIFTAEDSYGDKATHEVSQLINTPPFFTSTPILNAEVNVNYSYTIQVTDSDIPYGDHLTIFGDALPSWLSVIDNGDGTATLSGTPSALNVGINTVKIVSEDLNHHIDPRGIINQLFNITVSCSVNAIAMNAVVQLDANGQGSLSINDINNGSSASCGIDSMVLDKKDFDCNDLGTTHTVTLTVTDSYSNISTSLANVTVVDNISPTIVCPTNIDAGITSSPAGKIVTYTAPLGTDNCSSTSSLIAGLSSGSNFLPGINTITYKVIDSSGNTAECSFSVSVTLNEAPVATDDTYTIDEDITLTLNPLTFGTADNDPENNTLTITSINSTLLTGNAQTIPVTNGTVIINITGVITFIPNNDYNGTVTFPYEITDGTNTASANQTIIVTPVNDEPIAIDDNYTTDEDITINIEPMTDGTPDINVDGDLLVISSINGENITGGIQTIIVTNGTANIDSANVITYEPNSNYNGSDSFDYTICDPNNSCDTATITFTINAINDDPVAIDDSYTMFENSIITLFPLVNDNDIIEGDIVTLSSINGTSLTAGIAQTIATSNGAVLINSGGEITFTPDTNYTGNITFPYTISDGNTGTASANQIITVSEPLNSLGSIGDTVWYDTDGDGIKDADENGLVGATVTLDPGTPADSSDDVTIITNLNGNYLFTSLPLGSYTITVDLNTVTAGIPINISVTDLIAIYDGDGVGTANTSAVTLALGVNNLSQDFGYSNSSDNTGGGNNGGVESESLGDVISKIYVVRKKNSIPTEFVKSSANLYNKSKMKSLQAYQGKGQTMLDMFPNELVAGNVANVTSPTDILDYTVADEVLSVDFSINGLTKGVVLGIRTSDKVYNHTKASCDRLRGAEILNIQTIEIAGYNFLMQGIKQRNGIVEYAISFATAKNNNDTKYTIQTNWYVNNYTKFNDVYNFQVWSTKPSDTKKMVADILENLRKFIPVSQIEIQKIPETYASKVYREKADLIVMLRSTEIGKTAEVSMIELYSETANNIKHRYNSLDTQIQQSLRLDIADGYEYEGLVKVNNEVEDAFYHADGNWGLDYDKRYTEIKNYFVWNDFNREYKDEEHTLNRNIEIQATSNYDYLTIYKSLLPGTLSADYSEYKYVAFTAKGSGLIELGLIKYSIEDWKSQYRVMVDFSEEEQTFYVPFDVFTSSADQNKMTVEDLTTLTFTFLPVEAQTLDLDLTISDVRFTKTAIESQTIKRIQKFKNEFMVYPNPSKGNVNMLLFSEEDTEASITLSDITGKIIYRGKKQLTTGKNELEFNFKVKTGVMLLQVNSNEKNYGTSKIIFR